MLFGDAKESRREARRRRQGALSVADVPFFAARDVEAAVSPERAVEAVREAFVAYARGEWTMPPKVYVPAYPAGDFRAMPALGGGHALLKWVTSFPGNPAQGLPTVTGLVLLSDASNGLLRGGARRRRGHRAAHRRGRGARGRDARARRTRRRRRSIGAGVNGTRRGADVRRPRPGRRCSGTSTRSGREAAADELGAGVAGVARGGTRGRPGRDRDARARGRCSRRARSARASTSA